VSKQPIPRLPNADRYMASASYRRVFKDILDETKAHFQDYPWAMKLFSTPLSNPSQTNPESSSPQIQAIHSFVGRSLATEDTISAWQSFHSYPSPFPAFPGGHSEASHGEIITILKIGSGVNGHIDICHGGFVSPPPRRDYGDGSTLYSTAG
jgi:thioesterase superfamily protein 4